MGKKIDPRNLPPLHGHSPEEWIEYAQSPAAKIRHEWEIKLKEAKKELTFETPKERVAFWSSAEGRAKRAELYEKFGAASFSIARILPRRGLSIKKPVAKVDPVELRNLTDILNFIGGSKNLLTGGMPVAIFLAGGPEWEDDFSKVKTKTEVGEKNEIPKKLVQPARVDVVYDRIIFYHPEDEVLLRKDSDSSDYQYSNRAGSKPQEFNMLWSSKARKKECGFTNVNLNAAHRENEGEFHKLFDKKQPKIKFRHLEDLSPDDWAFSGKKPEVKGGKLEGDVHVEYWALQGKVGSAGAEPKKVAEWLLGNLPDLSSQIRVWLPVLPKRQEEETWDLF